MLQDFNIPDSLQIYVGIVLAILLGGAIGYLLVRFLLSSIKKIGKRRSDQVVTSSIYNNLSAPLRKFGFLLGALIALGFVDPKAELILDQIANVIEIGLYAMGAWVIVELVEVVGDILLDKYAFDDSEDNLKERKIYTQLLFIKRAATFVVIVLAIAMVLFQFDRVRELGKGLLASAGVAGIIIGVAAQKSLANLLAGFQIAFTQPIRIDDQILVAGEFGRVEEITLTYVVVKLWDERRLIVPLNKFIEDSFQNWSRVSTDLLGQVTLHLDYSTDIEDLRLELDRVLEHHELWDKRVKKLQVTDTSANTMTVRVLASAPTPGDTFTLRCDVREQLISYLQAKQPNSLPHKRLIVSSEPKQPNLDTVKD